ncbi:GNAT family N-acetyltransferase [Streptomyces canarius]
MNADPAPTATATATAAAEPRDTAGRPPVRAATPADAEAITRMRSEYVLSEPLDEEWLVICRDQLAHRLRPGGDARACVVDAPGGGLAACALALIHPVLSAPKYPAGLAARIHVVATEPAHRRRGLARAAVSALLETLEREGVTLYELHARHTSPPTSKPPPFGER